VNEDKRCYTGLELDMSEHAGYYVNEGYYYDIPDYYADSVQQQTHFIFSCELEKGHEGMHMTKINGKEIYWKE